MHKLVIPVQRLGFPRQAQKLILSLIGFILLTALWTEFWKGGWHLLGWVTVALFECILLARPLRRMSAPAQLGSHLLSGMDHVTVEVRAEGEAIWLDAAGAPIGLRSDEAWRCWLTMLAHHGFPTAATEPGCFRLKMQDAETQEPMPRRYPEYAPDRRSHCSQSFPKLSAWPFWCLATFFCALLVGSAIVGFVEDPMLAALGGGPITFITGGFLFAAWFSERRDLQSLSWLDDDGCWLLSTSSGDSSIWYPGSDPISPKRLAKVASHMDSPASETISQPGALALFLDDQAHAAWQAKRRNPVFTHSTIEQDSL